MKKTNKKLLVGIIGLLAIYLFAFPYFSQIAAPKAFGQTTNFETQAQTMANNSPINISTVDQIIAILNKIVVYVYRIFFIIAIFFILLSAYNFLFARGDPAKIKSARSEILWAAVAIAIALLSVGAAQIIQSFINNP